MAIDQNRSRSNVIRPGRALQSIIRSGRGLTGVRFGSWYNRSKVVIHVAYTGDSAACPTCDELSPVYNQRGDIRRWRHCGEEQVSEKTAQRFGELKHAQPKASCKDFVRLRNPLVFFGITAARAGAAVILRRGTDGRYAVGSTLSRKWQARKWQARKWQARKWQE